MLTLTRPHARRDGGRRLTGRRDDARSCVLMLAVAAMLAASGAGGPRAAYAVAPGEAAGVAAPPASPAPPSRRGEVVGEPPAAELRGVMVEPDGAGARIAVALSGPFRYRVTALADRFVITLDGVAAVRSSERLPVGPVTAVSVRPLDGSRVRAEVVVMTRIRLLAVGAVEDGHTLVVRAQPPRLANRAFGPVPAGKAGVRDRRRPVTLTLEEGAGRLLDVAGLVRVAVSNPDVLDVVPVSDRELLVSGRSAGRTTLYVWERTGRAAAYAVEVTAVPDRLAALRRLLATLFPGAAVTVSEVPGANPGMTARRAGYPGAAGLRGGAPAGRLGPETSGTPLAPTDMEYPARPAGVPAPAALPSSAGGAIAAFANGNGLAPQAGVPAVTPEPDGPFPASVPPAAAGGALVLSGTVETQIDRQQVDQIARAFAPAVVDLLEVRKPVQLELRVEVAEVNRSAMRSLGVTWGGGQQTPGGEPSLNGGVYNLQVIPGPSVGTAGLDLLIAHIEALVQQGRARLLAEPNLVVLAGRPASLLLGGQVPIPVAGPNGSVMVEYKDFGVILNARPDYQADGRVFMQITPEVSTLDFANAIKVAGFTIPALSVRRAQTVVSMRPSQTLVLGGLLQRQDSEVLQEVPVLGDLPVIGPLFRSRSFQRRETELVIFVTPEILRAQDAAAPLTP